MEHPKAVEQLAEEYARAGGDITQTFTCYSRDLGTPEGCSLTVSRNKVKMNENFSEISSVPGDKPGLV